MFRHTAVQVHKKIVRKDDHTMSIVPRPSGLETHPVIEDVELLTSFMTEEDYMGVRVTRPNMTIVNKITLS